MRFLSGRIPKFIDRNEKIVCGLFLAGVLVMAAIAGMGRSVSVYSDIRFSGFRFWSLEIVLLALWGVMFWAYKKPPARFWVYAVVILCAIIFAFLPPIASSDALSSVFKIKLFSVTHTNPYLIYPSQFPGDSWSLGTSWKHIPMPYGPFWVLLSLIFLPFIKMGQVATIIFYKLALSGAAMLCGRIIFSLADKLGLDGRKAEFIFLWNPLILLTIFSDAHNDIAMMLFLFLAIYFLLEEKFESAMLALAASAMVKYITVLAVPFFLLYIYRSRGLKAAARSLALPAIFIPAIFYIFWQDEYTFRGLMLASSIVSQNSMIVHTAKIFGRGIWFFVNHKELIWSVAVVLWASIFFWSSKAEGRIIKGIFCSFLIIVLATTDLFNWYILWPLALAPFMEKGRLPHYAALLSLFGILHINSYFWQSFFFASLIYLAALTLYFGPKNMLELCRNRIFGRV